MDEHVRQLANLLGVLINPATEEKQDDSIANQTDGTQKTQITDGVNDVEVETLTDSTHDLDGKKGIVTASAIYGRRDDDDARPIEMDAATHAIETIEYEHHEIHSGNAFVVCFENQCTNTGEQSVVAFNTPDTTKWIHIVATGFCTSLTRLEILENPTIDNDEGTQITPYNRDRNSNTLSEVTSVQAAPVSNNVTTFNEAQAAGANITGTVIASVIIGSSGGFLGIGQAGGAASGRYEFLLEQNQQYAFRATSLDNNDNYHVIELNWYEHTNKS